MKVYINRDYVENFIRYNKKTIIKVVAGLIVFVTAFFVFCIRDYKDNGNEFTLINKEDTVLEYQNKETLDEKRIVEETVTANSIKLKEKNNSKKIYIDVSGAVENPYVYEMNEGARVYEAIEIAGGLTNDADVSELNLAQILKDEDKIVVLTKEQINTNQLMESSNNNTSSVISENNNKGRVEGLVNINNANLEELQTIIGIGPATAEKIISYRQEHGDFRKIEEIMNITGIGEKSFVKIKNKIMV